MEIDMWVFAFEEHVQNNNRKKLSENYTVK